MIWLVKEESKDSLLVYHQFIIQSKLALGSTTQISSHQNLSIHIRSEHRPYPFTFLYQPYTATRDWLDKREKQLKTAPFEFIERLTVSITSTNASFFRYFTSFLLHEMAPVAWIVILLASSLYTQNFISGWLISTKGRREGGNEKKRRTTACSDLIPSVVIYILRVSDSEFWGYPKSRISVSGNPVQEISLQLYVMLFSTANSPSNSS